MKPVINVGIIGFGVVGCGVYDIFQRNARAIELRVGSKLVVKRVADTDPDRPRPIEFDRSILTTNPEEIINDPEIDIVAELIGGVDPAQDYIMAAIRNGKHVVT
ncbi:MAG TPA: homoserine dehydrogenase, partial [Armatimonadota bacterium]|nr:homoserine dehydrogenase [Armatimonadota bacterium]